jgi:hypothetical protein
VFGKVSRPRKMDPSMAELLAWPGAELLESKARAYPQRASPSRQFAALLKKTSDPYGTEHRDEFKQFHYDCEEKAYLPLQQAEILAQIQGRSRSPTERRTQTAADYSAFQKVHSEEQLREIIRMNLGKPCSPQPLPESQERLAESVIEMKP